MRTATVLAFHGVTVLHNAAVTAATGTSSSPPPPRAFGAMILEGSGTTGRSIEEFEPRGTRSGDGTTPRRPPPLREQQQQQQEQQERSLQSSPAVCDLLGDRARKNYQCTLDEYCDVYRARVLVLPYFGKDVTCEGSLTADYSIFIQGYVCIDNPGTTTNLFENVPFDQVCYNQFSRSDLNVFRASPEYARFDFLVGFSFILEETSQVCDNNPTDVCTCHIKLEGRDCNACSVCNDGRLIGDIYSWAVDCTNLADGLVRTCDATGWAGFYQQVEASLPFSTSPTTTPTTRDDPTTTTTDSNDADSNDDRQEQQRLSSAAVGGIIGAAVAVLLAGLLALVLCCVLRPNQGRRRGDNMSNGNAAGIPGSDDRPMTTTTTTTTPHNGQQDLMAPAAHPPPASFPPPMAQVLLVDHGSMDHDPAADSAPMFKDQMRPAFGGQGR